MREREKTKILKGVASYNENTLQREIVEYLNKRSGLGCRVSRIKNQGTWDPKLRIFRSNGTEKGIPDIIGTSVRGKAIYIEVKVPGNGKRREDQTAYLQEMGKRGALVGYAECLSDAFDIVVDDPVKYPRKDRTFGPLRILAKGTEHEQKKKPPSADNPLAFLSRITGTDPDADSGHSGPSEADPT